MQATLYPSIKKHVQPFETERFKLEKFELSDEKVKQIKMSAAFGGGERYREVYNLEAGMYVKLVDKKQHQIVMSDTPMELDTNREFVVNAKGTVLIGGLGIGVVLLAIQKKKEVKRVLVIEKEKELIDRIVPMLPLNKKVRVVHGDIFEFETKEKFDTLYFDIWNNICGDNWQDMKKLHARFRKNKNPEAWMGSWRKSDCQRLNRQDTSYY